MGIAESRGLVLARGVVDLETIVAGWRAAIAGAPCGSSGSKTSQTGNDKDATARRQQ